MLDALSTLTIDLCDEWITKFSKALDSLFFFDGIKAGITHPHRELEAHDWECGAFRTTFPTHSFATFSAVMLHRKKGVGNTPV